MNKSLLIKTAAVGFGFNLLFGVYPFFYLSYGRPSCPIDQKGRLIDIQQPDCFYPPKVYGGILLDQNIPWRQASVSEIALQFLLGWLFWWVVVLAVWFLLTRFKKFYAR